MFFPVGEFLPDQPDWNNPGASVITNVIPKTAQSYGPVPGLSPSSLGALAARCQGAIGVRDSANNSYNFAGTAAKLYSGTSASTSWVDASGTSYSCSSEDQWRFSQFGDVLIAHQIGNNPQAYTLNSSSVFADLGSGAPKARYSAVSKNFLIFGNTNDGTYGARPQRVWWSKVGDPTTWPSLGGATAIADQSDAQDIVGDHGWLQGLVPNTGPLDLAIFFERAIFRGMYTGAPDFWGFWPINGAKGTPMPGSIQRTEIGTIYVTTDYDIGLLTGYDVIPIGNQKIANFLAGDVNRSYLGRASSVVDPYNKLYYLAYASGSGPNTGALDTILVCNYGLTSGVGTPGRFARIIGDDTSKRLNGEYLWVSTSFGYNADNADSLGFNTDTSPYGPDSPFWTGNNNLLSMFDATTHIYGTFGGSNYAPIVETSERQLVKNARGAMTRCRVACDGGTPTVTPYIRNRLQDTPIAKTASSVNSDGNCFFTDAEGWYHRHRITLPTGSSFTHIQGIDVPDDSIINTGQV